MTEEVSIKVMPENATNRTLYFESSDENIAKISGNNIQAIKSGQATINVRIHNEDMAESISVNVLEILNDIKLNRTNATLYIGGSVTITATLVPDNAVNKDLEWISSDESIATVENGKITAKKLGKCNIKVKNTSEPIIERDISINVVEKPKFPSPGQGAQNANLTYINGILVVNKKYSVPSTYSPGINPTAYNAYIALKNAANAQDLVCHLYLVIDHIRHKLIYIIDMLLSMVKVLLIPSQLNQVNQSIRQVLLLMLVQ